MNEQFDDLLGVASVPVLWEPGSLMIPNQSMATGANQFYSARRHRDGQVEILMEFNHPEIWVPIEREFWPMFRRPISVVLEP